MLEAGGLLEILKEITLTSLSYFEEVWIYLVIGIVAGGFVSGFVPRRYIFKVMGGYRSVRGVIITVFAMFPLPLCSIGVIPLVGGFYRMGFSMGTVMAALVMGAAVNPVLFVLTADILTMRLAITRVVATFILAISIGIIANELEKRKIFIQPATSFEREVVTEESVFEVESGEEAPPVEGGYNPYLFEPEAGKTLQEKVNGMIKTMKDEIREMIPGLTIGFFLTGAIAVVVPITIIAEYLSGTNPLSLLMISGFTIPWYFPPGIEVVVAQAFAEKGMTEPGLVTFFLIATGTSIPNILMIAGFLGKRNAIFYAVSWIVGVTLIGTIYLLLFGASTVH